MGYYSGMVVDPGDDCSFWYTNQQLTMEQRHKLANSYASFKFHGCH
jgi:hypothetical protein